MTVRSIRSSYRLATTEPYKRRWTVVALAALAVLMFAYHLTFLQFDKQTKDRAQNLSLAVNLAFEGRFVPFDQNGPYARREPAYPFLLAGTVIALDRLGIHTINRECAGRENIYKERCIQQYTWLKPVNLILLMLTALLSAFTIHIMSGSSIAAVLGLLAVANSGYLLRQADQFMSEVLAAMLLATLAFASIRVVQSGRLLGAAFCGNVLGLLMLTKAIFQYAWFPLLLFLVAVSVFVHRKPVSYVAATATVFLCGVLAVTGPWLLRNQFAGIGPKIVDGRSGNVLMIRANYNDMTDEEYRIAYLYFNPYFGRKYPEKAGVPKRLYERLDRQNPDGFYQRGKHATPQDPSCPPIREGQSKNAALVACALERIRGNLWGHLRNVPLMLFRGSFREIGLGQYKEKLAPTIGDAIGIRLPRIGQGGNRLSRMIYGLTAVFALFFTALYGLSKFNWSMVGLTLIACYAFGMLAGLTHFIPRYATPMIPIQITCIIVLLAGATSRLSECARRVLGLLKVPPDNDEV